MLQKVSAVLSVSSLLSNTFIPPIKTKGRWFPISIPVDNEIVLSGII
jgi:hypothetical protein